MREIRGEVGKKPPKKELDNSSILRHFGRCRQQNILVLKTRSLPRWLKNYSTNNLNLQRGYFGNHKWSEHQINIPCLIP